ncbi:MAG: hypothetical protein A2V86_07775 [Deltaproteobacteria bacterium RBG_16_49_23]|nr:MAG: hypothetical protein A2V86_07775 [Deltaproteobacteria bacterium RBG_16_49_23]
MEYWNIGILKYQNIGIMEYWNIGFKAQTIFCSLFFPSFHYSIIPVFHSVIPTFHYSRYMYGSKS